MAGPDDELDIFNAGTEPFDDGGGEDSGGSIGPVDDRQALSQVITTLQRQGGRDQARSPAPYRETQQPRTPAQQPGAPHGVPDQSPQGLLRALLDERDRRQTIERELSEARREREERARQEQANQSPFSQRVFEDPDQAIDGRIVERLSPLERQMQARFWDMDMKLTKQQHGPEAVDEAFQAWYGLVSNRAAPNPPLYFAIADAPSPGEALMSWFNDQKIRQDIGGDLAGYRERLRAEIMEEMGMGGGGIPSAPVDRTPRRENGRFAPRQEVRLPSATSRMGRAASGVSPGNDEDGSEEAIFDAGRSRRR